MLTYVDFVYGIPVNDEFQRAAKKAGYDWEDLEGMGFEGCYYENSGFVGDRTGYLGVHLQNEPALTPLRLEDLDIEATAAQVSEVLKMIDDLPDDLRNLIDVEPSTCLVFSTY